MTTAAAIEQVPVDQLHVSPTNPRTISPSRLENLKASLAADPRLLELRPILATPDGEIYAGNMRFRAAVALGWATVPAIVEAVDARTKRERMIRDNEQWGEWSDELADVLATLQRDGSQITTLGLDNSEIDRLLASLCPPDGLDDIAIGEAPARVSPGDLWILGDHRLLCGDATRIESYPRLLADELVDLVWTDPPYGVSYAGGTAAALTIANDEEKQTYALLIDAFSALDQRLRPGSPIYVASPSGRQFLTFGLAFSAMTAWLLHQTLVWVKDRMVLGHSDYHYQHETLIYGWKRGAERPWFGGREGATVLDEAPVLTSMRRPELLELVSELRRTVPTDVRRVDRPSRSAEHPTMKPLALIEPLLLNSSARGAVVLDPFVGSGATLVASERLGRRCRAIELDPRYCDVVLERWERQTSHRAVRA